VICELNVVDETDEKFLRDMLEYSKFFEYYPKVSVVHTHTLTATVCC